MSIYIPPIWIGAGIGAFCATVFWFGLAWLISRVPREVRDTRGGP